MASEENNALATKIRSMYGKRITPVNYRELLRKQTVNEVAAYLKQLPGYSALLSDTNENLVHRGQLENTLRRQVFEEYVRMSYFIDLSERDFYEYVIMDMEINEILTCLRFINAGRQGDYLFSLPSFFVQHATFDLVSLAKVHSYSDLIDLLKGTPYQPILEKFQPDSAGKIDSIPVEIAFKRYYYGRLLSLIANTYEDESGDTVRNAIGLEIDLQNLMIILRLRKYFQASTDYIRSLLIPHYYKVSKSDLEKIMQEPDADSAEKAIFSTRYGESFKKNKFDFPEKYGMQVEFEYNRRVLRYTMSTPELVVSYMNLKNVELSNLISIIEGIRYSLPPAEIAKLLIGAEE